MFNEFQHAGLSTWKPAKDLNSSQSRLLDWATGLGGETGEVLDLIKHHIFHEDDLNKMELAKELGDVLWYISALASATDMDLNDIIKLNQAKLQYRYGGEYSASASANRHENETLFENTNIYRCIEARVYNTEDAPVSIIALGPDGSGKTTLTTILSEQLSLDRIKCDYRQDDKPALAKRFLANEYNVIYDRFYYPDELIYSKVKNIKLTATYADQLRAIEPQLKEHNVIILYVDASIEKLTERSAAWADDYVRVDQLMDIKGQYAAALDRFRVLGIPIIHVDTTCAELNTPEYDNLVEGIKQQVWQYQREWGTSEITRRNKNVKPDNSK